MRARFGNDGGHRTLINDDTSRSYSWKLMMLREEYLKLLDLRGIKSV